MTEDEKELEERIKQYQYQDEENRKKMEQLQNDLHKGSKKKSFIFRINKTIGRIVIFLSSLGAILLFLLLILATNNLIGELKTFDAVIAVEDRYDINLKKLSREAENKVITYKVKPTNWKYRNIEFTVVRVERSSNLDDFSANYLKYLIEKIKDNEILKDFEIEENYDEYGLLDYKLVYIGIEEEKDNKIQIIQNYITAIDKDGIIKFDEIIKR